MREQEENSAHKYVLTITTTTMKNETGNIL